MAVAAFCVLSGLAGPGLCFKEQTRGDNLITIGKDLEVEEGTAAEVAIALGGNVIVQGSVHGSVVAVAGAVYLGHASVVEGDIVCIGGPVVQEEGARVRGEITVVDTGSMGSLVNRLRDIRIPGVEVPDRIFSALGWLAAVGFIFIALAAAAVMPAAIGAVSSEVEHHTLRALAMGVLGTVLAVPVTLVLVATVVGILLIPLFALCMGCAFLMGYIAVAQLIGKRLSIAVNRPGRPMVLETLMGALVLFVIGFVPVAGFLAKAAATFLGFGGTFGAMTARWRRTA